MERRLMKWKAVCGDVVYTEESNAFSSINKDQLEYFYLEGLNTTFRHDVRSAQFTVNENAICFLLNDSLIGKSNDVINFKEKIKSVAGGPLSDMIRGYYTGWKEKPENFDYLEVLFWVDMVEQEIKIRVRATPNNKEALKSEFTMVMNGVLVSQEIEFDEVGHRKEFVFEIF